MGDPLLNNRIPHLPHWLLALLGTVLICAGPTLVYAQKKRDEPVTVITATFRPVIIDENEEPLAGVKVTNRSNGQSVIFDGITPLDLSAKKGDLLELSALGSVVSTYTVGDEMAPAIVLSTKNPAVARLKPVRLLFNTTTRADLTSASTQAVYNNDLQKMPVTSVLSALSGRLAGVFTNQFIGQPGNDGTAISLRNQSPLVIIDGIPRQLTVFDLEEIESITALKDAVSTAMLGVRGSNGALLITTRKGSPLRQRISFTAQTAIQQPLRFPNPLNAAQYASLYNEALQNDGQAPVYSDAAIQAYQNGSDPYRYPNVNWRDQVTKPSSRFDRYTFSASGGNNFSKYFVSLDHINQTGLLRESDANKYNTNNNFQAFTVRSNVDLQLSPKLSAGIYLLGRILNGNDAGFGTGSILANVLQTPNNAYPVYNPNGSYGGSQQYQTNIWAQTIGSGYQQNFKRDMLADFYLKRTLDELTPGLWVRAMGSYYATLSENIFRAKTFAVFQRNISPTGVETYQQFGANGDQANSNGIDYQGRSDYLEFTLGYDRTIGNNGFSALLLANRQNSVTGSDLPYTITGTSGRASYNYKQKYVLEASFGLNGSNRYPDGGTTKYGFFPAVGVAWNINQEDFLKSYNWLSYLKLFGSYGKTGNDNPGYFTYIQRYFDSPSAVFGTGAGANTSLTEQPIANRNISWEKANKLNLGLQGAVFNNRLGFTIEYYNMKYYDLLMQRGRSTSLLGNTYPDENIGQNRYSGVDLQLSFQQDIKGLSYYATVNAGFQNTKVLFMDEVYRPYDWMQRTGQRVGQTFGYIADGLFQTAEEVKRSATVVGYTPQPGDIKYKDLNGDGVIDQLDQAPIGNTKPSIPFGASLGFRWKGFDVSALVQGVANRSIYMQSASTWAFQNNGFGQAFEQHLDRWTPTNTAATYPRVWIGTNVNNQAVSSYWMRSGDYVRLKNVEIGYTVPVHLLSRIRVQSIRVFANGTNLLTANKDQTIDPESYLSTYPVQRLLNVGLNLKL
ncbi:SusC/RagA family TonB-linked outer membrane protein [uncultured Fibrella sp.]|uniref:SusC/RagA family TonB-linked outer membrane protein n=1 Tax=uncultured Fibrella sp. TaxID=1284596 RepID=UPI0035CBD203